MQGKDKTASTHDKKKKKNGDDFVSIFADKLWK